VRFRVRCSFHSEDMKSHLKLLKMWVNGHDYLSGRESHISAIKSYTNWHMKSRTCKRPLSEPQVSAAITTNFTLWVCQKCSDREICNLSTLKSRIATCRMAGPPSSHFVHVAKIVTILLCNSANEFSGLDRLTEKINFGTLLFHDDGFCFGSALYRFLQEREERKMVRCNMWCKLTLFLYFTLRTHR
jgi:hypothetical protein